MVQWLAAWGSQREGPGSNPKQDLSVGGGLCSSLACVCFPGVSRLFSFLWTLQFSPGTLDLSRFLPGSPVFSGLFGFPPSSKAYIISSLVSLVTARSAGERMGLQRTG